MSTAYTSSNVTTSVKRVSGRGKPTEASAARVTALREPVRRKRVMRSGGMPALSRRKREDARLNCSSAGGPQQRGSLSVDNFL